MKTTGIAAADTVRVTVITDNYIDAVRKDGKTGKRFRGPATGRTVHAEHGLSYVIETVTDDGTHGMFMFDYGSSHHVLLNNLEVLGIDVSRVQAFVLSHGHYDHCGGVMPLLELYGTKIKAGTPFFAGEEAFSHRFARRYADDELRDLGMLDRKKLESLKNITVTDVEDPVEIFAGAVLTGKIGRTTPYEKVPPTFFVMRGENLEADDFRGELAVVCRIKEKGIIVISGCAHVGIVNTVRHAKKITGIDRVHAVMGGFHLVNAEPEIIEKTIADIKAEEPDYIIPMHCTGFEATTRIAEEMPSRFVLNTAGTQYTFGA